MVTAVILASGIAKRFGENKLLMPLGEKKVIEHVIDHVKKSKVEDIFLIYGHHQKEFKDIAKIKEIKLIYNEKYNLGQSYGVKRAVKRLENKAEGILFLLGDQPFLTSRTINQLVRCFKKNPEKIIVPLYDGKRGNPVIFGKNFFGQIKKINGDKGPREIIEKYENQVVFVPINDIMENFDIDTKEDYLKALKELKRKKN
ncbi:molybdenum cofactor cytidylyltransferase [Garciella nitratireducens]|uniref:molybdenum cofactor cytidylyltransferase n=1 Tax=Garciella nitratireducens TaxID=218205 RepID=UPI000DEAFE95|nr:molybdenum cofactor cytidylyltransferase [Garciella nitratireducens]RBP44926.1 molybdenum cofactor cytidylyltransferase [Garciella nitratireducens]